MIIKWTKSLKKRFGWDTAKDVHVLSKECFNRNCFHPHDWHYDRHLTCLTNAVHGCPQRKDNEGSRCAVSNPTGGAVIDTREELAKIAGVSHDTIHKMKVIEEQGPEEVKESSEIPITCDPI
jgi:hypothetical protein